MTDTNPRVPHTYVFDDAQSGFAQIVKDLPHNAPVIDYFKLFFDDALMSVIVEETNRFFEYSVDVPSSPQFSTVRRWKDTDIAEMYTFLALTVLMPSVKKHAIRDYWDKESIIYVPVFAKFMSRDRYQLLLRFLHFCDNENPDRNDSMFKIRNIFERITSKCRELYKPKQKMIIDESLILFRGRVAFRQYIKTKRHRFGLKLFVLCDCASGSVLDMILYTGATTDIPANDPLGVSGAVVRQLMSSYVGKGHIMYTDNWYTSPMLCQYLHEHNTGSCGTVKDVRKFMPQLPKKQEKGDCVRKQCENILAIKWKDKRSVSVLSTVHEGLMVDSGKRTRNDEPIMKPDAIIDYNINMRLVDKSDMMIGEIDCLRKTVKWYKKLFFHLVDIALLNSLLYYKMRTNTTMPLRVFVQTLAHQVLEKHGRLTRVTPGPRSLTLPDRLMAQDFLARHKLVNIPLPTQAQRRSRSSSQRVCRVCTTTTRRPRIPRKKTTLMCTECNIPLCLPCYFEFHTLANY